MYMFYQYQMVLERKVKAMNLRNKNCYSTLQKYVYTKLRQIIQT